VSRKDNKGQGMIDKNSVEYFMREMTQEEFEIISKGKTPYEFNLIYRPERSKREDSCFTEFGCSFPNEI
jgi:hypothetical protein